MAWTSPRTWVSGELVTASLMNTHIRDNETFLYGSIVKHAAAGYRTTTTQVVATGTVTALITNAEWFDVDNCLSTSTGLYTAPEAGKYILYGFISIESPAASACGGHAYVNSTAQTLHSVSVALDSQMVFCGGVFSVAASDTLSVRGYHNRGSNTAFLNLSSGAAMSWFFCAQIG